jgi:hypothetical protein
MYLEYFDDDPRALLDNENAVVDASDNNFANLVELTTTDAVDNCFECEFVS